MDMRLPLKFAEAVPLADQYQRSLQELRVSVIDRCNFRCSYCMPADSLHGKGVFLPLEKLLTDHEIVDLVRAFVDLGVRKLRITGGEPLLQGECAELAIALRDATGRPVLVETSGSRDISVLPDGVTAIMDIKTPASGMSDKMDIDNISRLRPGDETKFVIVNRSDYDWAKDMVIKYDLPSVCNAVLFSPAYGELDPGLLSSWIIEDGLPVRINLQIHKVIGVR